MIAIAIDGPSGAGKSTVARTLAKDLGYIYVDTGAMYRAVALYVHNNKIDPKSEKEVSQVLCNINLKLTYVDGEQRIILNGEDVSSDIRAPHMSLITSYVSALPVVRDFLFGLQKQLAEENNIVMDGRDIGTVVLPKAQVKIFLTASPEVRATRRYNEFVAMGKEVDYDEILRDIIERDYNDINRPIAPLKKASDAVELDSSLLTRTEVIEEMIRIIRARIVSE